MLAKHLLWLTSQSDPSVNQKVKGSIPDYFCLHVKVSLGQILNPEFPMDASVCVHKC